MNCTHITREIVSSKMKASVLCALFFCWLNVCSAQPGTLNPSFGHNGIATADLGVATNSTLGGYEVLSAADGAIYFLTLGSASGLTIIKRHPDGSRDLSYGNNGFSQGIPIASVVHARLQTDGKIVVIGTGGAESAYAVVVRVNTNGNLDSTFGQNGVAASRYGQSDIPNDAAIQGDGKIVVAGISFSSDFNPSLIKLRLNANGTLDNTFPNGVQSNLPGQYASAVAIQADGKIVMGGSLLLRYNSNGTPDSSFNGTGMQTISGDNIYALGITSTAKIITYFDNGLLGRYNANGSLDSTFGQNGIQGTAPPGTTFAFLSMIVQPDDKIVLGVIDVVGNGDFVIERFNASGAPDSNFSEDGIQVTDFDSSYDLIRSIALQTDGRLLALGQTGNILAAARYNVNGDLDPSFDADGKLTDSFPVQGTTVFTSTAVEADGKILAAGYTTNGTNNDFALVRYNTDGTPDSTFSRDGKKITNFGATNDIARAIALQSDGAIVIAGSAGNDFALARYCHMGCVDSTFGVDGRVTTAFGSVDVINSIQIQSDGKIVAGGTRLVRYKKNGSVDSSFKPALRFVCTGLAIQSDGKILALGGDVLIARYNTNGTLDSSFGENGIFQTFPMIGTSIALQSDGKIVAGGYFEEISRNSTSQFAAIRIKPNGTLDSSFGNEGKVFADVGRGYVTSIQVENDSKILLAGWYYKADNVGDFLICRYNTDGTPDGTFGNNGRVYIAPSAGDNRLYGTAIKQDTLYAVGTGQFPGYLGVITSYLLQSGTNTFTSKANGNWNDPATWAGGTVPDAASPVIVQHRVTVTNAASCYSLKVQAPAGYVVVNTGAFLTITH